MTQYTENYRLELYEGTDKADLTDQYNVSMGILDGAMKGVVDDTDASVAGIRAELATTNSNLNATNINLAVLNEKVDANQTDQATTNLNFQNEIDTLKTTVDAVPETYATQEALAAVKTEVDRNTPLVEEHGNYFAQLGVTDEESATALHTEIDNAFQGTMSNTTAIEEMRAQLSPWKQFGTVTIKNKKWPFYSCGTFACIHINSRLDLGSITGGTIHNEPFDLPSGFHLPDSWNTTPQSPVLIFDGSPKADVAFARISISHGSAMLSITTTKDYTSAYLLGTTMVVFPVTSEPPSGGDNPTPPQEPPTATATFGAVPSLETEGGNDGSTTAKFSGSIAGKKLTVNNLSATYEFTSRLGEDIVYMPTSKIVVATVENGTGVEVPTSVKVSSSTLESSQTYPLTYVGGVLSFTPTAQTRDLGVHTGGTSTKELTLVIEFIANGAA